jgi:hypothetical protein
VSEAKVPAEATAVPIVDPKVVKQQAKDQKTFVPSLPLLTAIWTDVRE